MSIVRRMKVWSPAIAGLLLAVLVLPGVVAAQPQASPGKVTEVTLYRGQAMVTRAIPVKAPQGSVEIVVGDLPEQVVTGSLFAEGSEGVEVRAVRFRTRAVGEEPRDEVRALDEEIKKINHELKSAAKMQELLTKRSAYLDSLEGFVAPTAKIELSQGVLDAEALQAITTFSFGERQKIATEQLELEVSVEKTNEQLSLATRKRAELTGGASQTVREAVVFVEKRNADEGTIRLKYLVESCGWSPTYTFRAAADQEEIRVECNALIQQMTGEDWSGVALTLSTASPALSATGPGLAPFPVSLTPDGDGEKANQADLAQQLQAIRGKQKTAIMLFNNSRDVTGNLGLNWDANAAANEFQYLELTNPKDTLSALQLDNTGAEGPSLSYRLEGGVSLASRSDQQMVRILQTSLASNFYHVATPVLTSYVYREAELKNTSAEDLLAGPVNVYLDGSFVGQAEVPTVARGQTFVVGLGADPQVRSRRELANKTDSVQGGNRELGFEYRLLIENYKEEPVAIRLFDRLPHTDRTGDVRVDLSPLEVALSTDELYVRRERSKGILRWDVTVPAGATGKDAHTVEYDYKVDFDRNFKLGALVKNVSEQQIEFEQLQRARFKR
ncbi:MAG: mucoidy inhibitor MuiA family protein [Planctomycetes bacterium]|nr:mucoidy inhibitor MuiA family protein [Planctomycetota bacterium]